MQPSLSANLQLIAASDLQELNGTRVVLRGEASATTSNFVIIAQDGDAFVFKKSQSIENSIIYKYITTFRAAKELPSGRYSCDGPDFLVGWIEGVQGNEIFGWAVNALATSSARVGLWAGGLLIAVATAERYRGDIVELGYDVPLHEFRFPVTSELFEPFQQLSIRFMDFEQEIKWVYLLDYQADWKSRMMASHKQRNFRGLEFEIKRSLCEASTFSVDEPIMIESLTLRLPNEYVDGQSDEVSLDVDTGPVKFAKSLVVNVNLPANMDIEIAQTQFLRRLQIFRSSGAPATIVISPQSIGGSDIKVELVSTSHSINYSAVIGDVHALTWIRMLNMIAHNNQALCSTMHDTHKTMNVVHELTENITVIVFCSSERKPEVHKTSRIATLFQGRLLLLTRSDLGYELTHNNNVLRRANASDLHSIRAMLTSLISELVFLEKIIDPPSAYGVSYGDTMMLAAENSAEWHFLVSLIPKGDLEIEDDKPVQPTFRDLKSEVFGDYRVACLLSMFGGDIICRPIGPALADVINSLQHRAL